MWDNPRLLNMAAGGLVGMALLAFAIAGVALLLRSPVFPLESVELAHPLEKTTREEIEAALRGRVRGNFFAVSPADVRLALEQLPWVRRASVRRVWPGRLQISLEEHVALARWGEDALISVHGERFAAASDEPLPLFLGPAGSELEMARRYGRFSAALAPLGQPVQRLVLSPRYAWQLRLASGLHIMLGRDGDAAEARLRRFVAAYQGTVGRVVAHDYVDLRYPNGFALRVRELKG